MLFVTAVFLLQHVQQQHIASRVGREIPRIVSELILIYSATTPCRL